MGTGTHSQLATFVDLLLDAVCVVDAEGRFVFVSAACERIFGYTAEEMIGRPMIDMVAPEDRARTLQAAQEIMSGRPNFHFENRYVRKDGRLVHIMWSARWSETDRVRIAVARDITERKRADAMQTALYAISEAAYAAEDLVTLFQQIRQIIGGLLPARNFAVALHDAVQGELTFPYQATDADQATARATMEALCAEVVRSEQPLLVTAKTSGKLSARLRAALRTDPTLCGLCVPLSSHNGTIGALVLTTHAGDTVYTDEDKELLQFVSTQIATAIERKQLHTHLQRTAEYDQLTDLPNRNLLYDRLEAALARTRRKELERLSLLYLDLDKFKDVNDTLGHAAGDLLLQEVAKRLKRCLRDTDTVARIGGDEFVVLIEGARLPEHASVVAKKIRAALNQPIDIGEASMHVSASIGVARYPEDGKDVNELLRHADEAMYEDKRRQETSPPPTNF